MPGGPSGPSVVTIGEALVVLRAPESRRLESAPYLEVLVGGSEVNVAIGITRLGGTAAWCGGLANDDLGRRVWALLRAEGVDVSGVVFRRGRMGIMFVETGVELRSSRVIYYRDSTVATTFSRDDLERGPWRVSRAVHVSGINFALGGSLAETSEYALTMARTEGRLTSLDLNFRALLWSSEEASRTLVRVGKGVHLVLASLREAQALFGVSSDPVIAVEELRKLFACDLSVIKVGARGAVAYNGNHYRSRSWPVMIRNPLGMGDAFAAAFLFSYLREPSVQRALDYGAAAAALKATIVDSNNPVMNRDQLELLLSSDSESVQECWLTPEHGIKR